MDTLNRAKNTKYDINSIIYMTGLSMNPVTTEKGKEKVQYDNDLPFKFPRFPLAGSAKINFSIA